MENLLELNLSMDIADPSTSESEGGKFRTVTHGKRRCSDSDSDAEGTHSSKKILNNSTEDYPKKVILKHIPPSRPLGQLNSILVSRELGKYTGINNIKAISGGRLMLTLNSPKAFKDIQGLTRVAGSEVEYVEVDTNRTYGVIHHVPLNMSDTELSTYLASQSVTSAERFFKTRDGTKTPTYSVKLLFSLPAVPTAIHLGYSQHKVDRYVPPPLRCYLCQRYGHVADSCRSQKRCTRCGKGHLTKDCSLVSTDTTKFKCVNCGGNHSAAYGGCPSLKRQAKINTISINENISRKAALQKVASPSIPPKPIRNNSQIIRPPTVPVSSLEQADIPTMSYADKLKSIPQTKAPVTRPPSYSILGSRSNVATSSCQDGSSNTYAKSRVSVSDPVPRRPALLDGDILEKLIVLIITLHFNATTDPVGDKASLYTNLVKTIFSSSINIDNVSSQIQNLIPNINGY